MPTEEQVLAAFDALGGTVNQSMALIKRLETEGFNSADISAAINAAIEAGVLIFGPSGSIRKA